MFILYLESPDVKNWFSSNVNESPILGTSDQFEKRHLLWKGSQKKSVVEDSNGEAEDKLIIIRQVRSGDEKDWTGQSALQFHNTKLKNSKNNE